MSSSNRAVKKDNSRRKGIPKQKKAQRRVEATERNVVYKSLTLPQKVVLIANRPGKSTKELERLIPTLK